MSQESDERRRRAKELATEFLSRGDATGWFDAFYQEARGDLSKIPWADKSVNPLLIEWLDRTGIRGNGSRALVIGCGLGDDAEELARRGFHVTAFDVSAEAIRLCRLRFAGSPVDYQTVDLFHLPSDWRGDFDFVLESLTLQALPPELRRRAVEAVAGTVAPGGRLLVLARACDEDDARPGVPWPLRRSELRWFNDSALAEESVEDFMDAEDPPVRRFRVVYRRP